MVSVIRVVDGTGTGPTAVASSDAALAAARVHNYNLTTISSIIPAGVAVESVGDAPDLGPAGSRLTVVEARDTRHAGRATAGLGWLTGTGPGVFYEAEGDLSDAAARREIKRGLNHARDLREWSFTNEAITVASTRDKEAYATAVVLAVYGTGTPV